MLALTEKRKGRYRDVVPILALAGLRWGELAGLQVGDQFSVPGPGLRLRRAALASSGGRALYSDALKDNRARTVPLVVHLVPIINRRDTSGTFKPSETPIENADEQESR